MGTDKFVEITENSMKEASFGTGLMVFLIKTL